MNFRTAGTVTQRKPVSKNQTKTEKFIAGSIVGTKEEEATGQSGVLVPSP